VWMGELSPWKTTSLFGNNVWIMWSTWLPNLSTYSLAVLQTWRVIMGPTTIFLSKPSQNLPCVLLMESNQEFRIVGFLGCFPKVNSS
jgi:hypothetical protein